MGNVENPKFLFMAICSRSLNPTGTVLMVLNLPAEMDGDPSNVSLKSAFKSGTSVKTTKNIFDWGI